MPAITLANVSIAAVGPVISGLTVSVLNTAQVLVDVTTDTGTGIIYLYVSANATETASTIKASGSANPISSSGEKTYTFSGLSAGNTYYVHVVHDGGYGVDSNVLDSASFQTDGTARAITLANVSINNFNVSSFPTQIRRLNAFDIVVNNAATPPTTANTTLSIGAVDFTTVSVIGSDPYTITFLANASFAVKYGSQSLDLDIDGSSVTIGATNWLPEPGNGYVDIVDPSTLEGSVFFEYSGDAPATGLQVEHNLTTTPGGVGVDVLATGEWVLNSSPTQDESFQARVIESNAAIGAYATFSILSENVTPVITLNGPDSITLQLNATYTEQGATATDPQQGSIAVVVGGDTVDTSTAGTYIVSYNATDEDGNSAVTKFRTVSVVAAIKRVVVTLANRLLTQQANLSGISYAFYESTDRNNLGNAVDSGVSEVTDSSAELSIDLINTTLNIGQSGFLVLWDSNGRQAIYNVTVQ